MKKLTLLIAALAMSMSCFADPTSSLNNSKLKELGTAWKTYQTIPPKPHQHDINIVYGGEDISLKRNLLTHSSLA